MSIYLHISSPKQQIKFLTQLLLCVYYKRCQVNSVLDHTGLTLDNVQTRFQCISQ
jgi:hypothetical protein